LVLRPLIDVLYQLQMTDDDSGAIGGMRTGKSNRRTRRKPTLVQLRPRQIPHDVTQARTRTAAVTEQVTSTLMLLTCIWEVRVQISARIPTIRTEGFIVFLGPSRQMLGQPLSASLGSHSPSSSNSMLYIVKQATNNYI
jgi:hypothetical protein